MTIIAILASIVLVASCTSPVPAASPTAAQPTPPQPLATSTPTPLPPITVGGMFDLTGATAEIGRPYVDGVRRYIKQVNSLGGVNGRHMRLVEADYAYDVPKAVDAYKRLIGRDRVNAIIGWADLDTDALSPLLAADRVPYLSASYSPSLVASPAEHPYNFLIGASYADQMRVAIQYIKDNWHATDRPPNIAFLVADNTFGRSPLPTARGLAAQLGFKIVAEEYLPYDAEDAVAQLSTIRNKAADYVVVNDLTPPAAVALRDAARLSLKIPFITLNAAVDEDLIRLAGPSADSVVGISSFGFASEDRPGFGDLKAAYQDSGDSAQPGTRAVQGWLVAKVLVDGIQRAGNDVSGPAIKTALEAFKDYDTGGITAPLTWSKDDHANHTVRTYKVRSGSWVPLGDFVVVRR